VTDGSTPALAQRGAEHGQANVRGLAIAAGLALAFMVVEVVGGVLSGSLALLADAGHMLSDAAALLLSLFAAWIVRRPASRRRTYGYYRAEILAALANGATLLAVAALIGVEAWRRLANPPIVRGELMAAIGVGGLVANLAMLWVLHRGRDANLNVRGAWLHVATDTLGSIQVVVAGLLVAAFGWRWVDPAASALICVLVVWSAWGLLREAVSVLMESVPGHLAVDRVEETIRHVPGVLGLHDLHIWTIGSGFVALSAHVHADAREHVQVLQAVRRALADSFGITHSTIQIELPAPPARIL
jgi:cobalt-zinc-cadmium efflux system protein